MAMAEHQDMTIDGSQSDNDPVGSVTDGLDRLPAGTAVAEQVPIGPVLADISGAPALILAVIPFLQVRVELSLLAEASQLAGATSPQAWADQDLDESYAFEPLTKVQGIELAARGQRDIRAARMLTAHRPFRLTVPEK